MVKRAREFSSSYWRSLVLLLVFAIVIGATALSAIQGPTIQRMPNWVSNPVTPQPTIALRDAPKAPESTPGIEQDNDDHRVYPRPGQEFVPKEPPAPRTDALLAQQEAAVRTSNRAVQVPVNVAGQGYTGVVPADPSGAVGPSHFVQAINHSSGTTVSVYDKNGILVGGPMMLDSLGTGTCADGLGDPVVIYDRLADRWLLSEFAHFANDLCVYVSRTGDPLGSYWRYTFSTPTFPDYPKYAVWPNAYYATSNETSPAIYAFDRTQMLAGGAATMQRFIAPDLAGFGFQALTPADLDGAASPPGGSPAFFARHRDDEVHNSGSANGSVDFIDIFELTPNFVTPASSSFTGPTSIAVTEFDSTLCGVSSFNCFPQPGTATQLDPLREVIMYRLQYRNFGTHASMIGNFVVDTNGADHGGVRWFELRKTGGGAWTLYQEGTYSPDSTNRWMGGIAMDQSGNILLTYSVSSGAVFPGLRFTGRAAADALGTMTTSETVIVNGASANSSNRWGDYHELTIDPSDDCTFWFTGGYSPTLLWGTRIARLKFDGCGGPIITAGTGVVIYGNYVPANSVVDVGERVSVDLTLNNSGAATSNLSAVLVASSNVLTPNGSVFFGVIPAGGSATRQFRFTAAGGCGAIIMVQMQLYEGATLIGTISFPFTLACSASPQVFTDTLTDPLTTIKAVHVNELRARINLQRARFGLGAFSFTTPTLTPGATIIQAAHVLEMRTALAEAYSAAGSSPPVYGDSIVAGVVIQATHFIALRNFVKALEDR